MLGWIRGQAESGQGAGLVMTSDITLRLGRSDYRVVDWEVTRSLLHFKIFILAAEWRIERWYVRENVRGLLEVTANAVGGGTGRDDSGSSYAEKWGALQAVWGTINRLVHSQDVAGELREVTSITLRFLH